MTPALLTSVRRGVIEIIETCKVRLPEAPKTGRPRIMEWMDAHHVRHLPAPLHALHQEIGVGRLQEIVADAGYVDKEMEREMSVPGRVLIIKPYKTMKKVAAAWQTAVYNSRFQIEFDFRNLKLFYGLLSSLPRSINSMIGNYLFALLSFVLSK